jgi:tRNA-specific 2-thiouridylase
MDETATRETLHVIAAMSGGVDSATAAALLLREGHRVTGATLLLREGDGAPAAARMAGKLGIDHVVIDARERFADAVVRPFCDGYLGGVTPNPCVVCNERIKSRLLLEHAQKIGAEAVATGHYARLQSNGEETRLLRGLDGGKDQSYFLHRIAPRDLSRMVFPLGRMTKRETRAVARELGLEAAEKPGSQEACFVPGEGYAPLVEKLGTRKPVRGSVVFQGERLFDHEGIHLFTVGQRCGSPRGRGVRLFVRSIDSATGTVEAARREDVFFAGMDIRDVVWHRSPPNGAFEAAVKIRYRHEAAPAVVTVLDGNRAAVRFREPQFAVTPGQAAVFYDGDAVVGGGWIDRATTSGRDA